LIIGLIVLYPLTLTIRIVAASRHDDLATAPRPVRADVIIVLGTTQANGRPQPVLRGRLEYAIELYQRGYTRYLLFTGGKQPLDNFTEAEAGQRYAMEHGVPARAILLEDSGRTTLQSMQSCAAIMREHDLQRAIIVSDPFHAFRLRRMARDLHMQALVSPTPYSRIRSLSNQSKYTLREVVVYTLYRWFKV
jgi:uncharacterized SAM-binding protein YcdF (DUF218 family)